MPVSFSSSLFSLDGQVAVITGASRGIGRAIALRMAEAGARVVVSSRKYDACQSVVDEIAAAYGPGRAIAVAASLSDKAALAAMVEQTLREWGRIDTLVCNAAANPYYGPMTDITDEAFRKVLDSNVIANHWLIGMIAPQMRARRAGSIILVSSIGGLQGSPVIGAYNISKAADMQMARNLAVEFGPDNLRVNCIAPGLIRTAFSRALWDDEAARAAYETRTPLGRIGDPDEIAGTAVFLAAPASGFITGQVIVADGGVTISGI